MNKSSTVTASLIKTSRSGNSVGTRQWAQQWRMAQVEFAAGFPLSSHNESSISKAQRRSFLEMVFLH